jgi:large subunit ribosomal protein L24
MLIKVGDNVQVMCGNQRGTRGKVLRVDHETNKVIVEGVNNVWKHVRRSQRNPQGGRVKKEMPIDASNVMLVDPQSGRPTRVGVRFTDDGSKERFAKRSGATMGIIAPPRKGHIKDAQSKDAKAAKKPMAKK